MSVKYAKTRQHLEPWWAGPFASRCSQSSAGPECSGRGSAKQRSPDPHRTKAVQWRAGNARCDRRARSIASRPDRRGCLCTQPGVWLASERANHTALEGPTSAAVAGAKGKREDDQKHNFERPRLLFGHDQRHVLQHDRADLIHPTQIECYRDPLICHEAKQT